LIAAPQPATLDDADVCRHAFFTRFAIYFRLYAASLRALRRCRHAFAIAAMFRRQRRFRRHAS